MKTRVKRDHREELGRRAPMPSTGMERLPNQGRLLAVEHASIGIRRYTPVPKNNLVHIAGASEMRSAGR